MFPCMKMFNYHKNMGIFMIGELFYKGINVVGYSAENRKDGCYLAYDVLINLLDHYNDHNLLACLHYKPSKIVFIRLEGEKFQERYQELKELIEKKLPHTQVTEKIYEQEHLIGIKEILSSYKNQKTLVHVSGGLRPAAFLAFQGAIAYEMAVACMDIEHHRILQLIPPDREPVYENVEGLSVADLVESTGAGILKDSTILYEKKELYVVLEYIVAHYSSWKAIKSLFRNPDRLVSIAPEALDVMIRIYGLTQQTLNALYSFLDKLKSENLIRFYNTEAHTVHFKFYDRDVKKFFLFAGGWLEALTHQVIKEIQTVDDVHSGLVFLWRTDSEMVRNELDVVATYNSALVCISCKDTDHYDVDELNELDVYAEQLGGTNVRKIMVSTEPPKRGELTMDRARGMNIHVVLFTGDRNSFKKNLEEAMKL